jgi:hypothetical protein
MKRRVIRLTLAAGVALVASAPFSGTSSAITCGPLVEDACYLVFSNCGVSDTTRKVCDRIAPL